MVHVLNLFHQQIQGMYNWIPSQSAGLFLAATKQLYE